VGDATTQTQAQAAAASGDARREMLRRAAVSSRALVLLGPPGAVVLALLVDTRPPLARAGFVVLEVLTVLAAIASLTALLRAIGRDDADIAGPERLGTLTLAMAGAVWPLALVVLAPQGAEEAYLCLLFCVAAAASSLTASAAHRAFFLALVMSNLVPTTLVVAAGGLLPWVPQLLGLMAAMLIGILYVSWQQIHRTILEAIGGRIVEESLTEQLWETNARLMHRATHDELTGLANRSLFRDSLERHLRIAHETGGSLALLYLDLDRFKVVNDSLGHAEGDALLEAATERLRRVVRADDVLARLGGDEFTLLAPGADVEAALHLAERVRASFDDEFEVGGFRAVVTASVGVAMSAPGLSAHDLMRYADAALYEAKDQGRNRVALFDHSMEEVLSSRLSRESELRDALASREFEAWYQPLVDPRTQRIVAVEALARWRRGDGALVPPAQFLPLLADVGLMVELDHEIARQARAWRRGIADLVDDGFRVFTNVSTGDMALESLLELHVDAAVHDRTPLRWLGMEITEQAVVAYPAAARTALESARSQGLSVVLDDVGTGYSSLALIRSLPLDGLKIDASFVQGMLADPADAALVASVAALGRRLGLHVTAEGVETPAQLDAVAAEGVTTAQGYLFSPPVVGDELQRWLAEGPPWMTGPHEARRSRDV